MILLKIKLGIFIGFTFIIIYIIENQISENNSMWVGCGGRGKRRLHPLPSPMIITRLNTPIGSWFPWWGQRNKVINWEFHEMLGPSFHKQGGWGSSKTQINSKPQHSYKFKIKQVKPNFKAVVVIKTKWKRILGLFLWQFVIVIK